MTDPAAGFRDAFCPSFDGLQLHYRDYGRAEAGPTPILCLSGLTRNVKDFHAFAQRVAPRRRVVAMDYRGRGRSAHDPKFDNYNPLVYAADATALLDHLGIGRVILLGTSLGGIVSMTIAAMAPQRLAGVILNDIGPRIDEDGRQRIAAYVGRDVRFATLDDAARAMMAQFGGAYPDKGMDHWLRHVEDTFVFDAAAGNFRLDYDLNLAKPIAEQAKGPPPDLWPLFAALKPIPTLAVRGDLSDVLDAATFDRMAAEKPDLQRLVVPGRGHVPLPHEEPLVSTIENFIAPL